MIFRRLSRQYGWTPHDIGRLTLEQLAAYLGDASDTVLIDRHAVVAHLARHRQRRDRWIDAVTRRAP
ncbi:MAG: hypothetical protein R3C10_01805 [Pirellulales bacterium]